MLLSLYAISLLADGCFKTPGKIIPQWPYVMPGNLPPLTAGSSVLKGHAILPEMPSVVKVDTRGSRMMVAYGSAEGLVDGMRRKCVGCGGGGDVVITIIVVNFHDIIVAIII
jgi:hypothetical protein